MTHSTLLMIILTLCTISFLRFLSIYKPIYRIRTRAVYNILLIEFVMSFTVAFPMFIGNVVWNSNLENLLSVTSVIGMGIKFVMIPLILNKWICSTKSKLSTLLMVVQHTHHNNILKYLSSFWDAQPIWKYDRRMIMC